MIDEATRRHVRERAGRRCEYCLLPEDVIDIPFHIEHVIARQHRNDDSVSNLAIEGLTPMGRATVRLLKMNAPRRIQLRIELLRRGDSVQSDS